MSSRPLFRFVHASHLELDRFCSAEVEHSPEQSRLLIDAPFRAAERVFDLALREQAALIVLAGGTFARPQPSTWGSSFLARQCERVGRSGVTVYWAEASPDRTRGWPRYLPIPENLIIATPRPGAASVTNLVVGGELPVRILCGTDPMSLRRHPPDRELNQGLTPPFTIGVQPQDAGPAASDVPLTDAQRAGFVDVDYRAVQGAARATTFPASHGMARSSGTPQPRTPLEVETGGCLLVEVGPGYALGTQFRETNSLRYHSETVTVDDSTNWEGFRRRLHARTDELLQQTTADAVSFRWRVAGHGPVVDRLIQPAMAAELQGELRNAFGSGRPAAWIAPLCPVPDAVCEARWQRDAGPFGTFVRALDNLKPGTGEVDLAALAGVESTASGGPDGIDPDARHVAKPHFTTSLKAAARRHAAQILANLSR